MMTRLLSARALSRPLSALPPTIWETSPPIWRTSPTASCATVASGKHGGKGGSAVGIVTDAAAIDDDAVVGGVGDAAVTPAAEGLHGLTAVIDDRAVAGPGTVAIGHDAVDIAVGIAHPDLGVVVMGRSVEVGARCRTRGQQEQAHKADQGEPGGEMTVVEEGERGHGASWRHRD